MIKKTQLNIIYEKIARFLDISDDLFEKAEKKYSDLGAWIDKKAPDYKIIIYAQGSFALGTVIKPLSDKDEYDLDLVCEFQSNSEIPAKKLKIDITGPLLEEYGRCDEPIEKRRCWQVTYKDSPQFHMDIIPSISESSYISITDKNEENRTYKYIGSNPKAYILWFKDRMKVKTQYLKEQYAKAQFRAEVEEIPDYKVRTPLQQAIQILKRHRDILFNNDEKSNKPISIIITTLAAQLYENEDSIYDVLDSFLSKASDYVEESKRDGKYSILNPSYTGENPENFADKWNEHPDRAVAFFDWIEQAKKDLIYNINIFEDSIDIGIALRSSLGENIVQKVFETHDSDAASAIYNQTEEKSISLLPLNMQGLLTVPHRQKAPWVLPKGNKVIIKAMVSDTNGSKYSYKSNGISLEKGLSLSFTAIFGGLRKPYTVHWQIVNTGYEAHINHCLRGEFNSSNDGTNTWHESTQYEGSHLIQCFITKNGRCIAKSGEFIVNIK